MKKPIIIFIFSILYSVPIFAVYPDIFYDAQSFSMAKSGSAFIHDIDALKINIAGMSKIQEYQLSFNHSFWLQNTKLNSLTFAYPLKTYGVFGIAISYLYTPKFPLYNEWGIIQNNFSYNNCVAKLGYAIEIFNDGPQISTGLSVFPVMQTIQERIELLGGIDLGLLIKVPFSQESLLYNLFGSNMAIALVLKNKDITIFQQSQDLPLILTLGTSFHLFNLFTMNVDIDKSLNQYKIKFGAEYWIYQYFCINAGYKNTEAGKFTLGAMFKKEFQFYTFEIVYAIAPYNFFGLTHHFGFKIKKNPIKESVSEVLYYKGLHFYINQDYKKALLNWKKIPVYSSYYKKIKLKLKSLKE